MRSTGDFQIPSGDRRGTARRLALIYGAPLLAVGAATSAHYWLNGLLQSQPFSPYFLAVLIVAGVAGSGPALLTTALSVEAVAFLFLEPSDSFAVAFASDRLSLATFSAVGIGISALTETTRIAHRRAAAAQAQLAKAQARERAATAQRAGDELIRGILDSMPHEIAVIDAAGIVLAINKPFDRFAAENCPTPYGAPVGADYLEAIRPAAAAGDAHARAAVDGLLALLSRSRSDFALEYSCRISDGTMRWFLLRAARADCKPAAVIISQTDITERKRAEQALRESEERFASFMRYLPGLAWIKDAEGRYLYANDWALRAFDVSRERLYGRTDEEIFPPETAAQFRANDQKARESQGGVVVVETLKEADGLEHYSLVSKFVIRDADGVANGAGGVAIDITERELAQRRLSEATEKLRESDARKDEFLAMLAHELRNPLAPIRNAAYLLRRRRPTHPDKEDKDLALLSMIERQTAHLIRLVDDLLEASRITRGKIELKKQYIDLAEILRQSIETAQPVIQADGHGLEVSLPEQPIIVDGDPVRLTQIFTNLLNNAAKYTERGGAIWLSAKAVGGEALVTVQDSGLGIPAEMLPRIFDLFTQVDRTLGRARGGLGIGLALVKRLVELHGGAIEVQSEGLGRGAAFIVRLPALVESPAKAADAPAMADLRTTRRILIIEDNPDVAESQRILLETAGATVRVAYSGAAGLEALISFKPEIILLDLGMPKMDGYEAARRIRALPEGRSAKLVALTGWGRHQVFERVRRAGFDSQLTKPASFEALRELLGENAG